MMTFFDAYLCSFCGFYRGNIVLLVFPINFQSSEHRSQKGARASDTSLGSEFTDLGSTF
jgi:hypothetical protein